MSHRMARTARWMRAPSTLLLSVGLLSGTALAAGGQAPVRGTRILLAQASPSAATATPEATPPGVKASGFDDQGGKAERVNVENIKQKYWARGEESELGVVQNRLYSKEHKIELSGFYGFLGSDPFLNTSAVGGSIGFHLSEYLSLSVMGWKSYANPSSAFEGFTQNLQAAKGVPAVPDTNFPKSYYGGEVGWNLLYGKLSVLGKAIIYYDLHLLGGLGVTSTESGNNLTPHIGLGQQVFLSKLISLRVDYRLMRYNETLINKANGSNTLGDNRVNWTNAITVGVSLLFGFSKDQ